MHRRNEDIGTGRKEEHGSPQDEEIQDTVSAGDHPLCLLDRISLLAYFFTVRAGHEELYDKGRHMGERIHRAG